MIRLPWTELRFVLRPQATWCAPGFDGSMYRGALGLALRKLVCVMRLPTCEGCPLLQGCLYPRVFETRPSPLAGVMKLYDRAPHPFVLVTSLRAGEQLGDGQACERQGFSLRLFGDAIEAAPFIIRAVEEMAERGLGKDRVPFLLEEVSTIDGEGLAARGNYPPIARCPPPAELPPRRHWQLSSPLRISSGGRLVDTDRINGAVLGRAVLRRVGLLAQLYGQLEEETCFQDLADEADKVRVTRIEVRWHSLERWSSRQRARHSISGLVGTLELDFSSAPRIAKLADWVPVTHLGKATSMGLGRVEAEAA